MEISEITCAQTLESLWNSNRTKRKRFEILNNTYCPSFIIKKALYLYDPDEVLNLPAISFKFLWDTQNNNITTFLKDCIRVKTDTHLKDILGLKYAYAKDYNTLLYLQSLSSQSMNVKICCLYYITNKEFLKRFFKKNPDFLTTLTSLNTDRALTNNKLSLLFYLYSKNLISILELKRASEELTPPNNVTYYKLDRKISLSVWGSGRKAVINIVNSSLKLDEKLLLLTRAHHCMMWDMNEYYKIHANYAFFELINSLDTDLGSALKKELKA